jgi:RNA polymerase sigma-70 factor (ECF subfamily)
MDDPQQDHDGRVIVASLLDPDAFGSIFERHYEAVHAFIARRLGASAADELASDVFVVAFERRSRFAAPAPSARPWLYGIAVNVARRHARRYRTARIAAERSMDPIPTHDVVGEEIERDDEQRFLKQAVPAAISQLAARDRDALLLHCWEELPYEEVAEALGIPIGTVRSRINRARYQLRGILDASSVATTHPEGGNHHA